MIYNTANVNSCRKGKVTAKINQYYYYYLISHSIHYYYYLALMALPSTTLNSMQRCPIKAKKPTLTYLIKEPTEKDN